MTQTEIGFIRSSYYLFKLPKMLKDSRTLTEFHIFRSNSFTWGTFLLFNSLCPFRFISHSHQSRKVCRMRTHFVSDSFCFLTKITYLWNIMLSSMVSSMAFLIWILGIFSSLMCPVLPQWGWSNEYQNPYFSTLLQYIGGLYRMEVLK